MLTPSTSQKIDAIPGLKQDISSILMAGNNIDSNKNSMSFASHLDSSRAAHNASLKTNPVNTYSHEKTRRADSNADSANEAAHSERESETSKSAEHDRAVSNPDQKNNDDPNADENSPDRHAESDAKHNASGSAAVLQAAANGFANGSIGGTANPLVTPPVIPPRTKGQIGTVVVPVTPPVQTDPLPPHTNGQLGTATIPVTPGIPPRTNGQQGTVVVPVTPPVQTDPPPPSMNAQPGILVKPITPPVVPPRTNDQLGTVVIPVTPPIQQDPPPPMDSSAGLKTPAPGVGQNAQVSSVNTASVVSASVNAVSTTAVLQSDKTASIKDSVPIDAETKNSANGAKSIQTMVSSDPNIGKSVQDKPSVGVLENTAASASNQASNAANSADSSSTPSSARSTGTQLSDLERMQTVGKIDSAANQNSNGKLSTSSLGTSAVQMPAPLHNDVAIQPQSAAAQMSPVQDVFVPVTAGVNPVSLLARNEVVSLTAAPQVKLETQSVNEISTSNSSSPVNTSFTAVSATIKADTQTSSDNGGESAQNQESPGIVSSGIGSSSGVEQSSEADSTSQTAPVNTPNQQLERTRIVDQVTRHLENMKFANGKGEITLQMQPAHLGSLRITLSKSADGVVARIVTGSVQVQQAMQGAQEHLRTAMESKGLTLDKFQITLDQNSLQNGQSAFQGMHDNAQQRANQRVSSQQTSSGRENSLESDPIVAPITAKSNSASRLDYRA